MDINTESLNLAIAYLNILQTIIGRMSNYILAIQTASLTTLTALLAFSASDGVDFKWWIFIIPCIFFASFHFYFLRLERAFRKMYNDATSNNNISLSNLKIDSEKLSKATPKAREVLSSPSLYFFYPSLLVLILISYSLLGSSDKCILALKLKILTSLI